MRVAVIGMGSNSLRMLVSDVDSQNKRLEQVLRSRDGLRVFAALSSDNGGIVSRDMILHAGSAILNMKQIAEELQSEKIFLYATSATRDCSNQEEFIGHIESVTGLELQILSGLEEARFSFLGATYGTSGGVIDIGGGSTEVAIGSREELALAYSLQLGAVRLYRMLPILRPSDVPVAIQKAKEILQPQIQATVHHIQKNKLTEFVGVGGTFTSLSALIQEISWKNYEEIHGFVLDKEAVYNKMLALSERSVEQRAALISMQPTRADIIVNGIAVLYACMDSFGISKVKVSTKGNLEGYLIDRYF